jgi:hypothetical protein
MRCIDVAYKAVLTENEQKFVYVYAHLIAECIRQSKHFGCRFAAVFSIARLVCLSFFGAGFFVFAFSRFVVEFNNAIVTATAHV